MGGGPGGTGLPGGGLPAGGLAEGGLPVVEAGGGADPATNPLLTAVEGSEG